MCAGELGKVERLGWGAPPESQFLTPPGVTGADAVGLLPSGGLLRAELWETSFSPDPGVDIGHG